MNRDTLTEVGNDLRAKHSPSYIATQLYERAFATGKNAVIESIRAIGEVNALRSKGNFYLFAVDADREVRYQRIRSHHSLAPGASAPSAKTPMVICGIRESSKASTITNEKIRFAIHFPPT